MKYIRTKNGKIHISYHDYQGFEKLWVCRKRHTLSDIYYVRRSNIVKQADTIEELCDCFVAVGKKHYVWDKQHCTNITLEQMQSYPISDFEIYGAIWTDKGLIYVAKMNDKGELKLL